jgi:hypothetical protein
MGVTRDRGETTRAAVLGTGIMGAAMARNAGILTLSLAPTAALSDLVRLSVNVRHSVPRQRRRAQRKPSVPCHRPDQRSCQARQLRQEAPRPDCAADAVRSVLDLSDARNPACI